MLEVMAVIGYIFGFILVIVGLTAAVDSIGTSFSGRKEPSMPHEARIISNGLEYLKTNKYHHIGNIQYLVVSKFIYEELNPTLREIQIADNPTHKVRVVTQEQLDDILRNERLDKLEREVHGYRKEMQEHLRNKNKQEKK